MGSESPLTYRSRSAKYDSFRACPETCPTVDAHAKTFLHDLHRGTDAEDMVCSSDVENSFDAFRSIEQQARDELRQALIAAHERIIDLEEELEESRRTLERMEA